MGIYVAPNSPVFAQWKWLDPLPQGNDLDNIFLVSDNIWYAVGEGGRIIKTIDAGTTWTIQASNNRNALKSISCPVDDTSCYIVGKYGTILKTTDGGATWETKPSGTTKDLYSISCSVDTTTCYASSFSSTGTTFKTTDGGSTWNALTNSISSTSIACPVNNMTCYTVGTGGKILKTTDRFSNLKTGPFWGAGHDQ